VAISCAEVPAQPLSSTDQETGIDLGHEAFATVSTGERFHAPNYYRAEQRPAKCQRRVSRGKRGN
jgi:transposase